MSKSGGRAKISLVLWTTPARSLVANWIGFQAGRHVVRNLRRIAPVCARDITIAILRTFCFSLPGKVTCAAWIFIYVDYYSVILILCAIFRHFEGPGKKFMSTWITVNERRIMEVVWPRVNMIDRCILSVINIVILLSLFCAPYILRMFHNFFENCKKIQIYLSTSVICNFTVLLYLLIRKIRICESLSIRIIFIKKKLHKQFLTFYLLFLIRYQYCLLFDVKCKWPRFDTFK